MSKYYKVEDVIRKRAEELADTSYWEYGNPKNVDEWIEVAEMEFKDLPTIEVSEDCISRADWLHEAIRCEVLCTNHIKSDTGCDGGCQYDTDLLKRIDKVIDKVIVDAPSVVPMFEVCISKAYLEQEIENHLLSTENLRTEKDEWWNKAFEVMVEIIEGAPSVVPSRANVECYVRTCEKNKNGRCEATDIILEFGCGE